MPRLYRTSTIRYSGGKWSLRRVLIFVLVFVGLVIFISRINVAKNTDNDKKYPVEQTYTSIDNNDASDGDSISENSAVLNSEPSIAKNTYNAQAEQAGIPDKILQPGNLVGHRVIRVVDGDTVKINYDGYEVSVRLIGVNTPETVHPSKPQECFGREASNFAKNILTGKTVYLEFDQSQGATDRYDRLLAYVYVDGYSLNYALLYGGYGYEYTYNVPYKYQSQFKAAQKDAEAQNRGLWSPTTCNGR